MEESLTERMKKMEEMMVSQVEPAPKPFKLPILSRLGKGRVMKKEWCHVWMIRTNGSIQIKTCKVEDGTVKFGDYFYDARAGNILRWKRMPVLILKEWNISPETPPKTHTLNLEKDYNEAAKSGKLTAAQKLILTKMRMEAIKPKMNIGFGTIAVIAVVLIGGYFLLSSAGMI